MKRIANCKTNDISYKSKKLINNVLFSYVHSDKYTAKEFILLYLFFFCVISFEQAALCHYNSSGNIQHVTRTVLQRMEISGWITKYKKKEDFLFYYIITHKGACAIKETCRTIISEFIESNQNSQLIMELEIGSSFSKEQFIDQIIDYYIKLPYRFNPSCPNHYLERMTCYLHLLFSSARPFEFHKEVTFSEYGKLYYDFERMNGSAHIGKNGVRCDGIFYFTKKEQQLGTLILEVDRGTQGKAAVKEKLHNYFDKVFNPRIHSIDFSPYTMVFQLSSKYVPVKKRKKLLIRPEWLSGFSEKKLQQYLKDLEFLDSAKQFSDPKKRKGTLLDGKNFYESESCCEDKNKAAFIEAVYGRVNDWNYHLEDIRPLIDEQTIRKEPKNEPNFLATSKHYLNRRTLIFQELKNALSSDNMDLLFRTGHSIAAVPVESPAILVSLLPFLIDEKDRYRYLGIPKGSTFLKCNIVRLLNNKTIVLRNCFCAPEGDMYYVENPVIDLGGEYRMNLFYSNQEIPGTMICLFPLNEKENFQKHIPENCKRIKFCGYQYKKAVKEPTTALVFDDFK